LKLAILRSVRSDKVATQPDEYLDTFDTLFADRVIGNLLNRVDFCTACGSECIRCRKVYGMEPGTELAGIVSLPSPMPHLLERPVEHVPPDIPEHDVLLAIAVHEQVLLEILKQAPSFGLRAVVVPLETPDWISESARAQAHIISEDLGIEIAFPKPFCSFRPPANSVLGEFRRLFHIGMPDVSLEVRDGTITSAKVSVSAACGATYCVARWLEGRSLSENIELEVISRWWHSYPCTASMERDPELGGETPLHVAGQAHLGILSPWKSHVVDEDPLVLSPLGTMVQRPIPPEENRRNIEGAMRAVLATLETRGSISLEDLRGSVAFSPAILNMALLTLKHQGFTRTDGMVISRPGKSGPY